MIFAFGALDFQQFSDPTKGGVFCSSTAAQNEAPIQKSAPRTNICAFGALGFQQSLLSTKTNVLPTAALNEPKALQNTHGRPKTLPGCPNRRVIRRTFVYYTDYNEKFLRAMGGG